jgi:type II secretory pathway component PulF
MSFLVTPRQHSQRAELYQQLSQLTAAGIGLPQAVELQHRSPPARSFRGPLAIVIQRLIEGATFHEALQSTGRWLPAFDGALLQAGEQSGSLPSCFRLLADHYQRNAALLQKTISSLIYPAVLLHVAILIGPLPELVRSANVVAYLVKTAGVLILLYSLAAFIIIAMQGQHGERWRSLMEILLRRVPFLGKARRNLSLARLAAALEALIAAGVNIIEAWELAAAASGSPALRRAIARWKPDLLAGLTPAEAVSNSSEFPEVFANLYRTGEITGSLDDTLGRLRTLYQAEGERQLAAVADWTPKLIYFGVILFAAWQVIRFYLGYFQQIDRAINFGL